MCCYSIAKYLLFAFNFLFWLAGCAVLGVGIWLNVDEKAQNSFEVADVSFYIAGSAVFIAAGCVMLIVGFVGCCGAIKENTCLLGTYFTFLFVIFGLEVGIGIWAFVSYGSLQEAINKGMGKYNVDEAKPNDALVSLQKNLKCCGTTTGCTDWNDNINKLGSYGCACDPADFKNKSYCVPAVDEGCSIDSSQTALPDVYVQPCNEAVYDLLSTNLTIVGAVGLAIGLAEIFGMIIAMCLCSSIKSKGGHHQV